MTSESIAAVLEASGPIDVLVNNAGIGLFGAFEATPMAKVREVFETNTFGVMAMTQAVLSQFRSRRSGVVVNVTSSATLAPMPLVATYTASKMAIEGFTASLADFYLCLCGRSIAIINRSHRLNVLDRSVSSSLDYGH
jgi:short-subunit dehydrogenase